MRPMERLLKIWGCLEGISKALDTPYPTVSSWNARGIPLRRVKTIIEVAAAEGHEVQPWELHPDFAYLAPSKGADAA